MAKNAPRRSGFGQRTKMRSGKWQARYTVPDGHPSGRAGELVTAPQTFPANTFGWEGAGRWLEAERNRLVSDGVAWIAPKEVAAAAKAASDAEAKRLALIPTVTEYAQRYVEVKRNRRGGGPLSEQTKYLYLSLIRNHVEPTFGERRIDTITQADALMWFDALPADKPKTRHEVYTLVRAMFQHATRPGRPLAGRSNPFDLGDEYVTSAPSRRETLAAPEDIETILATIKDEHRLMVLLALWCGLRYGELTALRRTDIDLKRGVIRISRAVSRAAGGGRTTKAPKSEAGHRDQRIPESVVPEVKRHLRTYMAGQTGLVFPGAHGQLMNSAAFNGVATCATCKLSPSKCADRQELGASTEHKFKVRENGWYAARAAAGRTDLHFHDLRATGATVIARLEGATQADVQAFLGDSTAVAASRYIRTSKSRMDSLTSLLSEVAAGGRW